MKAIVLFILLFTASAHAGAEEEEAMQYATTAAIKQFGIEKAVNDYFEHKVPKVYRDVINNINPIVTAVIAKRVELKWSF